MPWWWPRYPCHMSLVSTGTSFCLCSAGWGWSIPLTSPHFSCPMLIPAPALWLAGKGQSCCTQRGGLARVGDNHRAQGLCTHRVLRDSCQQQGRRLALVSAANRLSSGLRQAEQTHRHVQHQGLDEIAPAPPPLPDAAPSAPAVPRDRSQDNFAAHNTHPWAQFYYKPGVQGQEPFPSEFQWQQCLHLLSTEVFVV